MLLAGEDTTANTLAWMIWLLWCNPAALAKARDEVRRICPDPTTATFDDISRLEYVEACAHETMRLRPVAPQQALQALRDTVLGDVQVRQGMVVFCVMRRDSVSEQHVPNASAFVPERWLNDARGSDVWVWSARGHITLVLEIKMAMAALLGHFDIDAVATPDGREPKEVLQIAMAPVGLTMRLSAEASSPKS
jgi:cytochrome P450